MALQNIQSLIMHSFTFIHSLLSENDKMYLQLFVTFTPNEVRRTHLAFSKEEILSFRISSSESLRVVGLLGEKLTIFKSHETTSVSDILFILRLSF